MFKINRSKRDGSAAGGFLFCFGISALLIPVFSLIATVIVGGLDDPTKHIGIFSLCALLLSALCSGIICGRVKQDGAVRFSALGALSVVLIMLLINLIISGGKISGGAFMNYGCYMGVLTMSSLLGGRNMRRRGHRH